MKTLNHVYFALVYGVVLSLFYATPVFAENADNSGNDNASGLFKFIVLAIVGIGIYRLQTRNQK